MEKNENTLISSKQKKAVKIVEKLLSAMHSEIKELNEEGIHTSIVPWIDEKEN